jgi:hypothetical protein
MEPTHQSRVHNITAEEMEFTITETLRASVVEMWLRGVKQRFDTPSGCGRSEVLVRGE